MKILILHSRYQSGPVSGENRVVEDERRLLSEAGHEVRVWAPAFERSGALGLAKGAAEVVWSRRAAGAVSDAVRREGVDVVHCHNLFPALSPSVIRAAADAGAPVVMTLHNYRWMCLPGTFLRKGRVCELCLGKVPWRGVTYRCYRDSVAAGAALGSSITLHRGIGTLERVRLFLAVSEFVRSKHLEAGFEPERVKVKGNFAWPSPVREGPGDFFLYAGRLSEEKGVSVLLQAWSPGFGRLVVAGDGPERGSLEASAPAGVEFIGTVAPEEIARMLPSSRALVLPSICYEGAPRSIAEAYAAGVPVVTTRMGGLTEAVTDGASGLLVAPGDPAGLRRALGALGDDEVSLRLGRGAFRAWAEAYTPERGLKALEEAYRYVLNGDDSPQKGPPPP
jgi:glycosyltransferase involved in cell wall biosynthesis